MSSELAMAAMLDESQLTDAFQAFNTLSGAIVNLANNALDAAAVVAAPAVEIEASASGGRALAGRVARTDVTVLITGESGTGREVFARYLHARSARHAGPFVAINCAAIPENMLEAMLFGHEKGSFTGATSAHAGKFEQAQGGTLLLDEISEMGLSLQAKLLRVLQEREVERIGGSRPIPLDVRVIGTSNRQLTAEVAAGRFREDLYYRLNVMLLRLAPLPPRSEPPAAPVSAALEDGLEVRERDLILDALLAPDGSRKIAALRLGISARTLRYKLAQLRALGVAVP